MDAFPSKDIFAPPKPFYDADDKDADAANDDDVMMTLLLLMLMLLVMMTMMMNFAMQRAVSPGLVFALKGSEGALVQCKPPIPSKRI